MMMWTASPDSESGKTLAEACQKTGFEVLAYCLMRNHFHLVVETPNANSVAGMRWLLSTYTLRLNHRRHLFGHVFSGRYKALIVDGSGTGYLKTVCDYVHLNPVRAKKRHSGELRRESAESKAERIIAQELQRRGWTEVELRRRYKSDPEKLDLAVRLRAETTLTMKGIAVRLHLGTWNSAHVRLQNRKGSKTNKR
jgi:REP element-mobilizing transposase RayT